MPERVGSSPEIQIRPFPVTLDELLDRSNRQRPVLSMLEERSRGSHRKPPLAIELDHFFDARLSQRIQRDHPATTVFADRRRKMEPFPCLALAVDVMNDQTRAFTDPETGLVEEQDQEIITPPERRLEIHGAEELADLVGG